MVLSGSIESENHNRVLGVFEKRSDLMSIEINLHTCSASCSKVVPRSFISTLGLITIRKSIRIKYY